MHVCRFPQSLYIPLKKTIDSPHKRAPCLPKVRTCSRRIILDTYEYTRLVFIFFNVDYFNDFF
jgi:hypothetical protein